DHAAGPTAVAVILSVGGSRILRLRRPVPSRHSRLLACHVHATPATSSAPVAAHRSLRHRIAGHHNAHPGPSERGRSASSPGSRTDGHLGHTDRRVDPVSPCAVWSRDPVTDTPVAKRRAPHAVGVESPDPRGACHTGSDHDGTTVRGAEQTHVITEPIRTRDRGPAPIAASLARARPTPDTWPRSTASTR